MVVTSIKQQKNNADRYAVHIDNEYAFSLDSIDVVELRLKEGMEIAQSAYERIMETVVFSKAKNRAAYYLKFKMRTKKELYDKLSPDFPDETIKRVILLLEKYNYINDLEYAKIYIKDRFNNKGYGLKRIKLELRLKGISQKIITSAVDYSKCDEIEAVAKLLNKKLPKTDLSNPKQKKKLYDFLLRRGFNYYTIEDAIRMRLENGE